MIPFGGVTGCSESSPVVIKVSTKGNRFLMVHRFAALGGAGMGLWGGGWGWFFLLLFFFFLQFSFLVYLASMLRLRCSAPLPVIVVRLPSLFSIWCMIIVSCWVALLLTLQDYRH